MCLSGMACSLCSNPSKYKCPRCEARTCSLACVTAHKAATACDGRRDRTKFVAMGKMGDLEVASDYKLLEEVGRGLESCRRDKIKRSTRQGTETQRAPPLPRQLARLQQQARARGVRLRLLPPHFARRKENTSVWDNRARQVAWRVELVFPHCSGGARRVVLPRVLERTKLWRLVEEQVEGAVEGDEDQFLLYKAVSYGGISLFLKAEGLPAPGEAPRRFYPLDMKRSLKTNLRGAAVVEHPVVHVVLRGEECNYREEQDGPQKEEEEEKVDEEVKEVEEEEEGAPLITSASAAQAADPEAYQRHFDFYLKYYSAKARLQGGAPPTSAPSHPVQRLLLPSPHTPLLPSSLHTSPHHPPPSTQPPFRHPTTSLFPPNYVPDFNRPPPSLPQPPPTPSATAAAGIRVEVRQSEPRGLGLLAAYGSDSSSDSD